MRILFLTREYPPFKFMGGVGSHLAGLTQGLRQLGDKVHVVLFAPPGLSRQVDMGGIHVHTLGIPHSEMLPASPHFYLKANLAAVRLARELMPFDVVHLCADEFATAATQLRQRLGVPFVTTFYSLEGLWNPSGDFFALQRMKGELLCCRNSDCIVCPSKAVLEQVKAQYGVSEAKLRQVYLGIDIDQFALQASLNQLDLLRRRLGVTERQRLILFVGRLALEKGVRVLLEAIPRVCARRDDVKFLVAGEGHGYDIHQLNRKYGEQALFTGFWPRDQVSALYQIADVLLIPSLHEAQSLVAVEGMAAGVPVVATDVDGLGEIVEDGVNGLKIPVRAEGRERRVEIKQLIEAIERLLDDQVLRERLAQNALHKVRNRFSIQTCVNSIRRVYTEMLEMKRVHVPAQTDKIYQ